MNKNHELKEGAVYKIRCGKDRTMEGRFLGYTMIGSEMSLVIRNGKGLFYVPSSSIRCMMLVEGAPEEKSESVKDNYYG